MRLPEIEGRGIFFRSHTFICVCPKLLFSVVWENYSGRVLDSQQRQNLPDLGLRRGQVTLMSCGMECGETDVKLKVTARH